MKTRNLKKNVKTNLAWRMNWKILEIPMRKMKRMEAPLTKNHEREKREVLLKTTKKSRTRRILVGMTSERRMTMRKKEPRIPVEMRKCKKISCNGKIAWEFEGHLLSLLCNPWGYKIPLHENKKTIRALLIS